MFKIETIKRNEYGGVIETIEKLEDQHTGVVRNWIFLACALIISGPLWFMAAESLPNGDAHTFALMMLKGSFFMTFVLCVAAAVYTTFKDRNHAPH